jgi:hypothetical protein
VNGWRAISNNRRLALSIDPAVSTVARRSGWERVLILFVAQQSTTSGKDPSIGSCNFELVSRPDQSDFATGEVDFHDPEIPEHS